jgi:hypothetical protein
MAVTFILRRSQHAEAVRYKADDSCSSWISPQWSLNRDQPRNRRASHWFNVHFLTADRRQWQQRVDSASSLTRADRRQPANKDIH